MYKLETVGTDGVVARVGVGVGVGRFHWDDHFTGMTETDI